MRTLGAQSAPSVNSGHPGLFGRLKMAGQLVLRGGFPLTDAAVQRYFGDVGDTRDEPRKSYAQVSAVYACVRARGEAIAGMPLMISSGDDEVIESGPLAQLAERPNANMTSRAFWLATSAISDLFGSVHWVMTLDALGRPVELVPVAPVQVTPNINQRTGEVTSWRYRAAGQLTGQGEILPPEQVYTIIDPDFEAPHHVLRGLSPRKAAALAIAQLWNADIANIESLEHGAGGGMALQTDQNLTQQQRDDLDRQLIGRHSGVKNRHRWMRLEGGLKTLPLGNTFSEMEFMEGKKMARADVCSAFGVPGAVVNFFEDSNYAHAKAAEETFWVNTIIPRAARLAQEWDIAVLRPYQNDRSLALANARAAKLDRRALACRGFIEATRAAKRTDRRFYAWFDSSGVPAVQRAHLEQATQAKTWFEMGVPLNDILQATDAPFHDQDYGNVGYKPIGLEPYGADPLDGIDDPSGAPTEPDGGVAPSESAVGGVSRVRGAKTTSATSKATEAVRRRLWAMWRKSWQPLERQTESRVRKHFYGLRSQTLANFHRLADQLAPPKVEDGQRSAQAAHRKDVIGEVIFDIAAADKKLIASVGPLYREAYRLGGAQSMREAADARGQKEPQPFDIDEPEVRAKLRARTVGVKGIDATLRRRLAHKLAQGVEDGQTIQQMADALKAEFNFARTRAATIARTEIGAAVEEARHEGRKQSGVPYKAWLWSRKEHGRPGHQEAEARYLDHPIPNDEEFIVDGYSCLYPRASSLPVGEVVNCACTCLSKFAAGEPAKATLARYARSGFLTYDQLTRRDAARMTNPSKDAHDAPSED